MPRYEAMTGQDVSKRKKGQTFRSDPLFTYNFFLQRKCTFSGSLYQGSVQSFFSNGTHRFGRHFKLNPYAFRLKKELLFLKIRVKLTLCFIVSVRNVVSHSCSLTGDLTNLRHNLFCFDSLPFSRNGHSIGLQISEYFLGLPITLKKFIKPFQTY